MYDLPTVNRSATGNITPTSQLTRNKLSDSNNSLHSDSKSIGKSFPTKIQKISYFEKAK